VTGAMFHDFFTSDLWSSYLWPLIVMVAESLLL
jgi:hypothetical protein